ERAMAWSTTRHGWTRTSTNSRLGVITPGSAVSGVACQMAWRRSSMRGGGADGVLLEGSPQAGLAGPRGGAEGGPAGETGTEACGVLVLKPLQDLGELLLERLGEPIGEAHLVGHQDPARLHEPLQGAHGRAWRLQRGECVAVRHQQLERQLRV